MSRRPRCPARRSGGTGLSTRNRRRVTQHDLFGGEAGGTVAERPANASGPLRATTVQAVSIGQQGRAIFRAQGQLLSRPVPDPTAPATVNDSGVQRVPSIRPAPRRPAPLDRSRSIPVTVAARSDAAGGCQPLRSAARRRFPGLRVRRGIASPGFVPGTIFGPSPCQCPSRRPPPGPSAAFTDGNPPRRSAYLPAPGPQATCNLIAARPATAPHPLARHGFAIVASGIISASSPSLRRRIASADKACHHNALPSAPPRAVADQPRAEQGSLKPRFRPWPPSRSPSARPGGPNRSPCQPPLPFAPAAKSLPASQFLRRRAVLGGPAVRQGRSAPESCAQHQPLSDA